VKQQLQNTAGYSSIILSAMDTVFMGTYAAGNIISGKLGDTFNPTTILVVGLLGNGVCVFLIAVSLWMDIRSMSVTLGNIFIITIYFLFGFFQSVGDPVGECHVTYSFLIVYLFTKLTSQNFGFYLYRWKVLLSWATGSVTRSRSKAVDLSLGFGLVTSILVILLLLCVLPPS